MICKFCGSSMEMNIRDYEEIYKCDCSSFTEQQEIIKKIEYHEREKKLLLQNLYDLQKSAICIKKLNEINAKYGLGIFFDFRNIFSENH